MTTHAAARQRVVDAARLVESWDDDQCACPICESVRALDALGPEPARDDVMQIPPYGRYVPESDLHDARALAWAGWDRVYRSRTWLTTLGYEDEWNFGIGWLTRAAEHEQHKGTYWVDEARGGGRTDGSPGPSLAATPAPSGPEVVAGGDRCPDCGRKGEPGR